MTFTGDFAKDAVLVKDYGLEVSLPMVEDPSNSMATVQNYQLYALWNRLIGDYNSVSVVHKFDTLTRSEKFTQIFQAVKKFISKVTEDDFLDQNNDIDAYKQDAVIRANLTEEEINLLLEAGFLQRPYMDNETKLAEYILYWKAFFNACEVSSDLIKLVEYGDLLIASWMPNNWRTRELNKPKSEA